MDEKETVNQVLVKLFRRINTLEEQSICKEKFKKVTLNEIHVIETIGIEGKKNMSAVAKALDITTGTLTISVNSLVRKGLVERVRSEDDRRVVLVSLTDLGREAYVIHEQFHEKMINGIMGELNGEEQMVLAQALEKLNKFFLSQK